MQLTRDEFDKKYKNGTLKIAFVGMSNIGKSFRAEELEKEKNFEKFSVDDFIGQSLAVDGINDLASWMGFPYDEKFEKNQAEYLKKEAFYTQNALKDFQGGKNFVLDTTGSVVYLDEETLNFLKDNFLIVGFKVPENLLEDMVENFFKTPKPIVWGKHFNQQDGESKKEALKRNYPHLLKWRSARYEKLADVSLETYTHDPNAILSCDDFLSLLREQLEQES